jgi:lysophospholipid acyltransferase (LPLAT)-like uncharacterized protein
MRKILNKIKYQFLAYPLVYLAKAFVRLILSTCKLEVRGLDHLMKAAKAQNPCILVSWHNRLSLLPEILQQTTGQVIFRAVISNSRDGHLLAMLIESYKRGRTLRVPHNGRYKALVQIISELAKGEQVIVLTPDGPRGPRYAMKPGILVMAKETNALIIPFSWSASAFWQLNTWDKMIFPKPFSKIIAIFGAPIEQDYSQSREAQLDHLNSTLTAYDLKVCKAVTKDPNKWPK